MTSKQIETAVKKSKVTKHSGKIYTVDLTPAGYNASMDVSAKDEDAARTKVIEVLESTPEHLLPQPIEEEETKDKE